MLFKTNYPGWWAYTVHRAALTQSEHTAYKAEARGWKWTDHRATLCRYVSYRDYWWLDWRIWSSRYIIIWPICLNTFYQISQLLLRDHTSDRQHEFLVIPLRARLSVGSYVLVIHYNATIRHALKGFYRSYYTTANGKQRWGSFQSINHFLTRGLDLLYYPQFHGWVFAHERPREFAWM